MKKFINQEKVQLGSLCVKKRRARRLLNFIKQKYAPGLNFNEPGEILDDALNFYLDDILWFYEGSYLLTRSFRLLSIRPRSRKEMKDFLAKNADNQRSIELVMKKLEDYLNDNEFAEYLLQKERSRNPKGNLVIKNKLREKGIDEEIIEKFLSQEYNVEDLIRRQYERKEKSIYDRIKRKGTNNIKFEFEMKMKNYLFSKGFSISDIENFFENNKDEMDYSGKTSS